MVPSGPLWDPSIFKKTLKVIGIRVPSEKTSGYLKHLSGHLLKQRNLKPVQTTSTTQRLVYLDPVALPNIQSVMAIQPLADLIRSDSAEVKEHDIELNYDSFFLDQALRMILPPEITELPSAFETVGHIAHLNLKAWLLPYKHIIGQLILDVRHSSHCL
jgi:tRNA (guanine37-N1)-methyltransferase